MELNILIQIGVIIGGFVISFFVFKTVVLSDISYMKKSIEETKIRMDNLEIKHYKDMEVQADRHNAILEKIGLKIEKLSEAQAGTHTDLQLMGKDLSLVKEFKLLIQEVFGVNGRLDNLRRIQ